DAALLTALQALPDDLARAVRCDWMGLADALDDDGSLFVLGRGPTLAIAGETALKFKETCLMHAEAYSEAEVMHGPLALVEPGFHVLALASHDAAEESVAETADALSARGATVFTTSARAETAGQLEHVATGHPLTDALALIVPFYAFVEAFDRLRGLDPYRPRNLLKVTETRCWLRSH